MSAFFFLSFSVTKISPLTPLRCEKEKKKKVYFDTTLHFFFFTGSYLKAKKKAFREKQKKTEGGGPPRKDIRWLLLFLFFVLVRIAVIVQSECKRAAPRRFAFFFLSLVYTFSPSSSLPANLTRQRNVPVFFMEDRFSLFLWPFFCP